MNEVGLYLRTLGEFDEAKTALQKALKIDEQVYGPDHPTVAIRVNNLGLVLRDLGDFQEAKKMLRASSEDTSREARRGSPQHETCSEQSELSPSRLN